MKKIQIALYYVLTIHLFALMLMTCLRIVLLICNVEYIQGVDTKFAWVLSALLRGVWFDNVIASVISILPLLILSIFGFCNKINKTILWVFNIYYSVLYLFVLALGTANIPYFNYFFKHLNASIFTWKEEGGNALGMMLEEKSYYVFFLFFVLLCALFIFALARITNKLLAKKTARLLPKQYLIYIPLSLILLLLCLLGIRGRFGYNPIKTSQAYFCTNSFINQLGINPIFYFVRDVIETSAKHYTIDDLISDKDAILQACKVLGISSNHSGGSILSRQIEVAGESNKMNVVIILMESMSADWLRIEENGKPITPYLRQLIQQSYYFENIYSAGIHTNSGVMSTLCGIPSLFNRNPMKQVDVPLCQGISYTLQQEGYQTSFFMPHEAQYDNMKAFLLENGVVDIYSQEDYPTSKIANSFGVSDDYLFDFALATLNDKAQSGKPFQTTILTVSNHPPYIVPHQFEAVSEDPRLQIVAFADDAIRQFMEAAQQQAWYNNTIFILLADHGSLVGTPVYDMPLSYNHIPMIIHSPKLADAPRRFDQLGLQIDVFPTIMGLLNAPYANNTMGVDLLKTQRPYIFFTSDNAIACIDNDYFYSYNVQSKMEGLYDYKANNAENMLSQHRLRSDSMRFQSAAMLQTGSYMLKHKLTRD